MNTTRYGVRRCVVFSSFVSLVAPLPETVYAVLLYGAEIGSRLSPLGKRRISQTGNSTILRCLSLAVSILGISADAWAATFLCDARCSDNVPHFQEGIGQVSSLCGVGGYPVTGFSSGTASTDSFGSASAGPSGLRLSALHFLSVAGVKSGSRGNSTQTYAAWNFDDFIVTGPGSTPVPATLRLFVTGTMGNSGFSDGQGSLTSFANGGGQFYIEFKINGADAGNGSTFYNFNNGMIRADSTDLLAGRVHGGAISDIITSNELMLPVGGVYSVEVEVFANATGFVRIDGTPADEFDSVTAGGGGYSDFQSTVTFPTSGPVFDLPPGYTVNSPSAGIVNNRFVVPEPTGDYNGDGGVDAADYVVWRKNDGTPAGYDTWRTNFGATAAGAAAVARSGATAGLPSSAGASANAAIPEPATLWLAMACIAVLRQLRHTHSKCAH